MMQNLRVTLENERINGQPVTLICKKNCSHVATNLLN